MLPSTAERVPENTREELNQRILEHTRANVTRYQSAPRWEIERRLQQLDEEWDIERAIEANAATVMLLGLGLGTFVNRRFYILPLAVGAFLLQHALQGWCPPVPVLRRLGFRTQTEIDEERFALKALLGDFVDSEDNPEAALEAARI